MTDPKKPSHAQAEEAARAARIKRAEEAVKRTKETPGLMPSTPEEADRIDELGRQRTEAENKFWREYPGLHIPPKDGGGRNR